MLALCSAFGLALCSAFGLAHTNYNYKNNDNSRCRLLQTTTTTTKATTTTGRSLRPFSFPKATTTTGSVLAEPTLEPRSFGGVLSYTNPALHEGHEPSLPTASPDVCVGTSSDNTQKESLGANVPSVGGARVFHISLFPRSPLPHFTITQTPHP